jgi:hypothetical protein
MRENIRLYATLAIWFAFMAVTIVIFTASSAVDQPNTAVFIALILALAASVSTAAVWLSGIAEYRQSGSMSRVEQAKRKRVNRERLERLVNGLNDDEIDELETLLIARDELEHDEMA